MRAGSTQFSHMLVSKVKPAQTGASGWANSPFAPPALMRGDKEPMSGELAKGHLRLNPWTLKPLKTSSEDIAGRRDFCKREVCKEE